MPYVVVSCIMLQYYEEMGKPTPKVEVMKHLKSQEYTDAKDYAGECESVVMIAKGQSKNIFLPSFSFLIESPFFLLLLKCSTPCRRARDVQVWDSSRLHTIILKRAL